MRNLVENREMLINHYGPLSYEEIGFLLNKMTAALNDYAFSITVKKKVYAAMVESLENVYKHQDVIRHNNNFLPKFSLLLDNRHIRISASNSILNQKIDDLKQRIDKVNQLDKKGLKEFYREIILSGNVTQKGGAGLGIVNIAKVSENKLDYSFERIDPEYSYFTLNIAISHNTQQK